MTDSSDRVLRARSGSRMMHGGFTRIVPFTIDERAQLDAIVDTLVPPEEGWPDSATLRIADLVEVYVVPDDEPVSFYPHWRRTEFGALLSSIGGPLEAQNLDERVGMLKNTEASDPTLFGRLRDFVYYVYYGHPNVVEQIQAKTTYGTDYHGGPQPEGYSDSIESWGDRSFTTRGVFIRTDAVLRTLASKERA
ncbi:hypothetical protein BH10ACT7_BH10ACT7_03630 [soil metagenome]